MVAVLCIVATIVLMGMHFFDYFYEPNGGVDCINEESAAVRAVYCDGETSDELFSAWLMTVMFTTGAAVLLAGVIAALGHLARWVVTGPSCRNRRCPCVDHRGTVTYDNTAAALGAAAAAAAATSAVTGTIIAGM